MVQFDGHSHTYPDTDEFALRKHGNLHGDNGVRGRRSLAWRVARARSRGARAGARWARLAEAAREGSMRAAGGGGVQPEAGRLRRARAAHAPRSSPRSSPARRTAACLLRARTPPSPFQLSQLEPYKLSMIFLYDFCVIIELIEVVVRWRVNVTWDVIIDTRNFQLEL